MKLFYSPAACSLCPHIVLRETALPFELERVDLRSGRTERDLEYRTVNPKGYVPALQLDDGQVLTEVAAIVQYLADRRPDSNLAPAPGSFERYRLQEWLHYVGSELHKSLGSLFGPQMPAEYRAVVKAAIAGKLALVSAQLAQRTHLLGPRFTVADAYLFVVLRWSPHLDVDLGRYPPLQAYLARIGARPAVQAALRAEGLA